MFADGIEVFYKDSTDSSRTTDVLAHFLSHGKEPDQLASMAKKLEYFVYAVDKSLVIFFAVFDDNDQLVGGAFVYRIETVSRTTFEVQDVLVFPAYEGKGHGTKLVKAIINFVEGFSKSRNEPMHIMLSSKPKREAANHMYKKLGFTLAASAVESESIATNLYLMVVEP